VEESSGNTKFDREAEVQDVQAVQPLRFVQDVTNCGSSHFNGFIGRQGWQALGNG
jgi:hypothetical protein